MTNNPGIYKITSPKNKIYIGQSRNVRKRINMHNHIAKFIKHNSKLYASMVKYGKENHIFELAHELPEDISIDTINQYEKLYYDLYKDCGCEMLNLQDPGNFHIMTEETKQKIRDKNIGRVHSEETKMKLKQYTGSANNRFGVKHSETTLEKMRAIKMGDNNPIRRNPEARSKISQTILGSKWMYKDGIQSQIKPNDVQSYIDNGWKLGRLKFKTK